MNPQAEELNKIIQEKNPAVYELLSKKGKNIFFPKKGILGQSADAKGTKINATIGTAIEDDGSPMRLEAISSKIGIDPSLTFPYAPSFGRPDIRASWKQLIYKKNPCLGSKEISLPIVTNALTHGVSMAGYMFVDEGDEVISPNLFWGNYNLILNNAYGSKIGAFNLFKNGGFDLEAFENKLNEGAIGKKIVILNFPNNPSGYSPTVAEASAIAEILKKSADKGNKIVVFTGFNASFRPPRVLAFRGEVSAHAERVGRPPRLAETAPRNHGGTGLRAGAPGQDRGADRGQHGGRGLLDLCAARR